MSSHNVADTTDDGRQMDIIWMLKFHRRDKYDFTFTLNENKVNPFASIGRTGTSNVSLLKSAGRRTGMSNDISSSKVSLYISRNMVSFFFLLWF